MIWRPAIAFTLLLAACLALGYYLWCPDAQRTHVSAAASAAVARPVADAPPVPAKVDPPPAKVNPVKPVCGCLDCQCEEGKPCTCVGLCKCQNCPGQIKKSDRPIHVSPDGTVNELHPDGVYRPIPGEPKRKPAASPQSLSPPRYSSPPYCPPGG